MRLGLLLITFFGFLGFTVFVVLTRDVSFFEFLRNVRINSWAAQIIVDLYIACGLIVVWMFKDARKRGKSAMSVIPYAVVTALVASMGPLLYLIGREVNAKSGSSESK